MSGKRTIPSELEDEISWERKYKLLEQELKKKKLEEISDEEDSNDDLYISPDKPIRVMNLCPGILNLSSGPRKEDKHRTFTEFGQVKPISYSILLEMMEWQPTFFETGRAYILNKDVIKKNGLDESYGKIVAKGDMEKILSNSENALDLYKTLNPQQRESVNDMLIEKIRNGELNNLGLISAFEREGSVKLMEKAKRQEQLPA